MRCVLCLEKIVLEDLLEQKSKLTPWFKLCINCISKLKNHREFMNPHYTIARILQEQSKQTLSSFVFKKEFKRKYETAKLD